MNSLSGRKRPYKSTSKSFPKVRKAIFAIYCYVDGWIHQMLNRTPFHNFWEYTVIMNFRNQLIRVFYLVSLSGEARSQRPYTNSFSNKILYGRNITLSDGKLVRCGQQVSLCSVVSIGLVLLCWLSFPVSQTNVTEYSVR